MISASVQTCLYRTEGNAFQGKTVCNRLMYKYRCIKLTRAWLIIRIDFPGLWKWVCLFSLLPRVFILPVFRLPNGLARSSGASNDPFFCQLFQELVGQVSDSQVFFCCSCCFAGSVVLSFAVEQCNMNRREFQWQPHLSRTSTDSMC